MPSFEIYRYVWKYYHSHAGCNGGHTTMQGTDVDLYYEVHGEGEPIVFVHGWMDDCTLWNAQVEYFSKKYKVIIYDHRGHGRSDKPKDEYSIQTLANDLHSLLQVLDLEQVTLVGHSMGGMAALQFVLDHPDNVSKLVLIGATAKTSRSLRVFVWILRHLIPYQAFAKGSIKFKCYEPPSEPVINAIIECALMTPKHAAFACFTEYTKHYDLRDKVASIKVPTLIVVGAQDKSTPPEMSRYLHNHIEGSQLEIIPDCGHMAHIEKPDELNEVIAEFIR